MKEIKCFFSYQFLFNLVKRELKLRKRRHRDFQVGVLRGVQGVQKCFFFILLASLQLIAIWERTFRVLAGIGFRIDLKAQADIGWQSQNTWSQTVCLFLENSNNFNWIQQWIDRQSSKYRLNVICSKCLGTALIVNHRFCQ